MDKRRRFYEILHDFEDFNEFHFRRFEDIKNYSESLSTNISSLLKVQQVRYSIVSIEKFFYEKYYSHDCTVLDFILAAFTFTCSF